MSDLKKVGAKITLDGEKEYKQALKDITSNQKLLRSEMKLAEAQYKATGGSMESMQAKSKVLNDQIGAQKDKIDILKQALENAKDKYGENSTQVAGWQQQLNYAEVDLLRLNGELADNEQAIRDAGTAADNAGGELHGFGEDLSGVEEDSKGWGETLLENLSFTDIINMGKMAMSAVSTAAQAVYQTVKESAQYADDVLTTAVQKGISTADVQTIQYMSELIDTPTEAIEGAMTRITTAMAGARDGTSKYKDAFGELGVEYQNKDGTLRNASDVFWDTVDALGNMEAGADRDALAMSLFGKKAEELTGVINIGKQGFHDYAKEADAMGVVLSDKQLAALGDTSDAMYRLDEAVKGFKLQVSAVFAPAINGILETITGLVSGATSLISGLSDDFLLEVAEIDKANDELKKKIKDDKDSFQKEQDVISGSVIIAGTLADRIFELAGKSERTATEENELAAALMKINRLVPGLNLQFDKQTGTLSKTREEVDKLTTAYKKQALEQAFAKQRSALLENYGKAVLNQIAAQQTMLGEVGEHLNWYAALQDTFDALDPTNFENTQQRMSTALSEVRDLVDSIFGPENADEVNLWLEKISTSMIEFADASDNVTEAEGALDEYNEQCRLASEQMGIVTEAIDDVSDAADGAAESTDAAASATTGYTAEIEEETVQLTALQKQLKAYADSAGLSLEEVETHFSDLADAYAAAYQSAEASITGQTGLFSKLEVDTETHLESIVDNLTSQNAVLEEWTANIGILQEAVAAGTLDQSFVNELINAGPQMATAVSEIAEAVTNGNTVAIDRLNTAYQKQIDIKQGFAETMAEAQTGFNAYAESIGLSADVVADELSARGVTAGQVYGEGLTAGLEETASVDDTAEEIVAKAEANAEAYQQAGAMAASSYSAGMQASLTDAKTTIDTNLTEIETKFKTSSESIAQYGTDASLDFLDNLNAGLTDTMRKTTLNTNISTIGAYFTAYKLLMTGYGTDSAANFMDGLITELGDNKYVMLGDGTGNTVPDKLKRISNIVKNNGTIPIGDYGTNAGDSFMSNLIAKLNDRLPEVETAAAGVAAAVSAALDIHSPSKVMERIGGFAAEGLTGGFVDALQDGLPEIAASMDGLTDAISGNMTSFTMAHDTPVVTVQAPSTDVSGIRADINALASAMADMRVVLSNGALVGYVDTGLSQRQTAYRRRN